MTVLRMPSARGGGSGRHRHDVRDRPGEGGHFPSNGHDDLVNVFPAGAQLPIPLAQAHLRLPADRLDLGRQLLQSELEMPAHLVVLGDVAHSSREARYFAFGRTDGGRLLTVVFTVRGQLLRVISARPMSRRERRGYAQATRPSPDADLQV